MIRDETGVNFPHGLYQAASRASLSWRDHLQRPHLDASPCTSGRALPDGRRRIEIDSIEQIGFPDITPELARESGFLGVLDLLKVAKHGKGENIYLVRFHYVPPAAQARKTNSL